MGKFLQDLEICRIQVADNQRVLKSMEKFYHDEVKPDINDLQLRWGDDAKSVIDTFLASLRKVILETEQVLGRAQVLKELATNRHGSVSFRIAHGNPTPSPYGFLTLRRSKNCSRTGQTRE